MKKPGMNIELYLAQNRQIRWLWVSLVIVFIAAVTGWFLPSSNPNVDKPYTAFKSGDVLRVEQEICTECSSKCFVMTVIGDQHVMVGDRLYGQVLGNAPDVGGNIGADNPRATDSIPWPPEKYEVLFNENTVFYHTTFLTW